MARSAFTAKLLLSPLVLGLPLLASACVFGGDSEDPVTPSPTAPVAPAISRSGPSPTPTPFGGPTPRPTLAPPPTAVVTQEPEPARSPVDGLVSVVYSFPFVWPAEGPITSFMSPEHVNGIDIGLNGSENMQIRAAAGGRVSFAGGSDEDALGISVVIDHGNGVTTTYGHLSALAVAEGDEVEIGQRIGTGGSTGHSTGNHLHFEVRKDGETVDPLHVLPSAERDTTAIEIDCGTTPFTLPSGSQALVNFDSVLAEGEEVVSVTAVPLNDGPALEFAVENENEVHLASPIDFDGPDGLDSYDLEVTVDNESENRLLTCGFVVQRRDVPTTFYVRAAPPASDVDGDEGESGDGAGDSAGATAGDAPDAASPAPAEPTPTAPNEPNSGSPSGSSSSGGGSTAGGSTPGGSTPGGSRPGGSAPGGSTPGGSGPGGGTPGGSN